MAYVARAAGVINGGINGVSVRILAKYRLAPAISTKAARRQRQRQTTSTNINKLGSVAAAARHRQRRISIDEESIETLVA